MRMFWSGTRSTRVWLEATQRAAGGPNPEIKPMVLRSMQAFWRELPGLLMHRRNHRKWAAYHGEERVAITRSKVDAYRACFRRGLTYGEFYVGKLEPAADGIPPWGTIECDRSLYEATEPGEATDRRRMKILDRLPILNEHTSVRFGDRYVMIRANQILVWMSVHLPGVLVPEENIPRFPALLDTGNNFRLLAAGPAASRLGWDRSRPVGSSRDHHA